MTAHEPLWARLDFALVGDGQIEPLRVGDTFVGGLAISADRRDTAEVGDGLRATDSSHGLYAATGTARSCGNHWVLDTGGLLLLSYQDPPGPTVGHRYTLRGTLAVAWTYEWDLATEPEMGGAPNYDGRRRWLVQEIQEDMNDAPTDDSNFFTQAFGGAVQNKPAGGTSFPHRDALARPSAPDAPPTTHRRGMPVDQVPHWSEVDHWLRLVPKSSHSHDA
ncbi:hypothetical protein [Actinopolymorpha pittospori]|uniref:Uncharacterized protein n=1 Tax=Actinopolymorpha pittospori TaxID=648752 RepID=A0A927MRP2_9ACTN|nr:hypothetical protein [Actinopolymorpha pittospori]MBE1605631.1 hypothetical protein [Actinopolymorpha pittospori]